ncbi:MAG: diguanylate cyclase [archaeon]
MARSPRSSIRRPITSAARRSPSHSAIAEVLRNQLVPARILNSTEFQAAKKYAAFARSKRLGRGAVTDPHVFNNANNASIAARRIAFKNFQNPSFQKLLKDLPVPVRERLNEEYREIKHISAAMRWISDRQRIRHHMTPEAMNDRAFAEHVAKVLSSHVGKPISVARVDLDKFGEVNKDFGHAVGNLVLERMTERYRQLLKRKGDEFGRMGGEEFDMFHLESPSQLKRRLDGFRVQFERETSSRFFKAEVRSLLDAKLSEREKDQLMAKWKPVSFTAGIMGYSRYSGKKSFTFLSQQADHLMKATKKKGRGRTAFTTLVR